MAIIWMFQILSDILCFKLSICEKNSYVVEGMKIIFKCNVNVKYLKEATIMLSESRK
jgi:predicted transcriptional regulator